MGVGRLLFLLCAACAGRGEEIEVGTKAAPEDGGTTTEDPPAKEDTGPVAPPEVIVTVCPDGSAEHTTLQEAVDAAPEGAVVLACNVPFTEPVIIDGRALTLRGHPGTVLDGGGVDRGLWVTSGAGPGSVTVEGLTITNGDADRGGGVLCEGAELVLRDVVLSNNRATQGGALAATNCVVHLVGVDVHTNVAEKEGGGGHIVGGTVTVERSRFGSNRGADGGGLLVQGAEGDVSDSVFEDNAGYVGGGLWFDGALRLTRNVFRRNEARFTGGGFAGKFASGEVIENEVYSNTCGLDGGGGYTSNFTGRVVGNDFHDNVAGDDAGGLRMFFGMALVEDNRFVANTAVNAAGAMKVSHAEGELRSNTFEDNEAGGVGGALEIDDDVSYSTGNVFRRNHAGTDGGGVHMLKPRWHLNMDDSVFEDNTAGACGGGLAMEGVAWSEPHTLTSSRLVFARNQAARGGAVCVQGGAMVLDNAVFTGNQGDADGGGLLVEGANVSLRNVVFHANQAGTGSALALLGVGTAWVSEVAVVDNPGESVRVDAAQLDWRYNLELGATFVGMVDPSGRDGNFSADPAFVDPAAGDFRLGAGSSGIDAGDPMRRDVDGSRVDVGAFGGEGGRW